MTLPALAVKQSGYGGRGYKNPVTGDGRIVPSVTTILKAEAKPAIAQWVADNTAAYAIANATELLSHSEEWGYKYLRWYHSRTPNPDDPDLNIYNHHQGVLNDAAEQGTWMHEWIQADIVKGLPYPDVSVANQNHWDMIEAWEKWKAGKDFEPLWTETTVWNGEEGYAGTFDGMWRINDKVYLMDIKTSRGVHGSAWMQLAALRAAPEALVAQPDETYIALRDWQKPVQAVGVLHVRPRDVDNKGNEMAPFVKWVHGYDEEHHLSAFRGLLQYQHAQRALTLATREREKNGFA